MTDFDVLERLRGLMGGSIISVGRQRDHWKPAWVWYVYGDEARRVMHAVKPQMGVRRQAKIEEVEKLDDERRARTKARSAPADAAAAEYLQGGMRSIREAATKHGAPYANVYRRVRKLSP